MLTKNALHFKFRALYCVLCEHELEDEVPDKHSMRNMDEKSAWISAESSYTSCLI